MNKTKLLFSKLRIIIPLMVFLYTGILLIYYPFMRANFISDYLNTILPEAGLALILIGVIWFYYSRLDKKIDSITNDLKSYDKSGIHNIAITQNNSLRDIIKDIEDRKYIYKISIFLTDPEPDDIFYIKDLLTSSIVDSKIRILVCISDKLKNSSSIFEQLTLLEKIRNNRSEIRILNQVVSFSFLIFDTNIWLINSNKTKEISSSIHFKIDVNSRLGEEYIWFFNNNWDFSKILSK